MEARGARGLICLTTVTVNAITVNYEIVACTGAALKGHFSILSQELAAIFVALTLKNFQLK